MTDRVESAVDAVAGATAAGATKAAARRNTTTEMRFRFARMKRHDRQAGSDLHGLIESLAPRRGTSSRRCPALLRRMSRSGPVPTRHYPLGTRRTSPFEQRRHPGAALPTASVDASH